MSTSTNSIFGRWDFAKEQLHETIKGDIAIWVVVVTLALCSMLVVYSATGTLAYQKGNGYPEYFLLKHGFFTLVGLALIWYLHRVNYTYFSGISRVALFVSIPLLLMLKIPGLGVTEGGATRWLDLGLGRFQPSDFARLALITNLAAMLAKRQNKEYNNQIFFQMVIWVIVICGLLALSSFSTALLLGASCFLMLFVGLVPTRYLLVMVVAIVMAGSLGLMLGQRKATANGRIERFLSGNEYQARQGFVAIANGGTAGKGIGQSHQRNYLTQAYSDFAYAIIIEEYGLLGGVFVLVLYLILLVRGVQNIQQTKRPFGGLLSVGLTLSIVLQAVMNMCVNVGLIPVTGQPLPLLSMGGTSVIFTCIGLGIILSVSRGEVDESNL
jgi:cell division protein FtsW